MDINETLSNLRGSLAEGGIAAVFNTLREHFSTTELSALVWEIKQESNSPLRDYLRAHVTAWDVLAFIIERLPKLFSEYSPYMDVTEAYDAGPMIFLNGQLQHPADYTLEANMWGRTTVRLVHGQRQNDIVTVVLWTPEGFLPLDLDYNNSFESR
jgi:hypothetical protein